MHEKSFHAEYKEPDEQASLIEFTERILIK